MVECVCGLMAVFLVGEDGVPMCLTHYCEELDHYCLELDQAKATIDIAHAALVMAEQRTRWMPIQRVDTGGLL